MFELSFSKLNRSSLIIAVLLTAVIGSLASSTAATDSWYLSLNKSELNPPGYVFGIVWPILYLLMIISAVLSYKKVFNLFIIQLIFNAAWSWLFFRFKMPLFSLLDIFLLIGLNSYILKLMYEENKIAFILFIPYVLWITFASYLNLYIVINN
tara:strand:+ start:13099 stop:13557 length:459 start_codon:yes stop_codon:yes gene_type:complete